MKKLKETLNLPSTGFSMKANLAQKEPEILKFWEEMDLYSKISEKNKNKPKFILHDGPPYANGPIHLGHVANNCLLYTSPSPRDDISSRMPSSA